jgi:hypothetical protein
METIEKVESKGRVVKFMARRFLRVVFGRTQQGEHG